MSGDPIVAEIRARFPRVRCGLDIGFADPAYSQALRDLRGGVWMTCESTELAYGAATAALAPGTVHRLGAGGQLPYDGSPFELTVLNGTLISVELVREIHRVLAPAGLLLFSVPLRSSRQPEGYDLPTLYRLFLKNGFDVVALHRPAWWRFGFGGGTLTVCGRKKTWKESLGRVFRF